MSSDINSKGENRKCKMKRKKVKQRGNGTMNFKNDWDIEQTRMTKHERVRGSVPTAITSFSWKRIECTPHI